MPSTVGRIDPDYGIHVQESNPVRDCAYQACFRRNVGYEGRKLKMCAKCKNVRYCSNECQKAHWVEHKERCKPYQTVIDYTGWMKEHDWLLRWIATEALRVNTTDDILNKFVNVWATYSDRVPASMGDVPYPFFIIRAMVVSNDSMDGKTVIIPGISEKDFQESKEIRARGGCGRACFMFNFMEDPFNNPSNTTLICKSHQIDLTDPPVAGRTHSLGWQSLFSGIVNGKISLVDLSKRIGEHDALHNEDQDTKSLDDIIAGLNGIVNIGA
ncbi:hypothetical protein D9757_008455 [Collybiopsis confluens]|uniref:MYND-type domain-containing protein n=1 Tax=Collybiopsis confluens TaxID=2823264 RepID=A0A8H5HFP7_9AGAR|nr:hypothetical protein D9757_008455 [Collybiopsis confluens]